jgi:hypothetical protein
MLININLKFLVNSTTQPLIFLSTVQLRSDGCMLPTYYDSNLIILNSAYAANMAAAFSIYDKHLR